MYKQKPYKQTKVQINIFLTDYQALKKFLQKLFGLVLFIRSLFVPLDCWDEPTTKTKNAMKKALYELLLAVLCLLPVFVLGYFLGLQLEKTIF